MTMSIDDRWQPTLLLFQENEGEPPTTHPDGRWSIRVPLTSATLAELLARTPCEFESHWSGREPMLDASGADVDDETTYGVWSCEAERAIVAWSEHWQAGVSVTLTVYPTEAGYRDGMIEARASFADAAEDPSHEEDYLEYMAERALAEGDPTDPDGKPEPPR